MKKMLSVVLVMAMVLALFPAGIVKVSATESGFYYEVHDSEAEITNYTGSDRDVIIPETLGGYPVTAISGFTYEYTLHGFVYVGAFEENPWITSVTIPEGVEYIGPQVFYNCWSLVSISFPNSLLSIDSSAIEGTAWYQNQPDGLLYIGSIAYRYRGLMPANTTITIKDGTKLIDMYAFSGKKGLTNIIIPASVTSIAMHSFEGCSGLISIIFPDSLTFIGGYAFYGCSSLTNILIPDSIQYIGEYAFSGCTDLANIVIPDSINNIGQNAFTGTSWYNNLSDGLIYIAQIAYAYKGTMPANTSIAINAGIKTINDYAFIGCTGLTEIIMPASLININYRAFYGCSGLTNIIIHSVTTIGHQAFNGCFGLKNITVPGYVLNSNTWESIFYDCNNVETITITEGLTTVSDNMFSSMPTLKHIYLPEGVTSIMYNAFYGCIGLQDIVIPGSVTSIGARAFYNCKALSAVVISPGVTNIDNDAFSGCTRLVSVSMPNSLTSIGAGTFYGCAALTDIVIPASVTGIGLDAFKNCSSLVSVTMPIVPALWKVMFAGCGKVETITLLNGATVMPDLMFKDMVSLKHITLPDTLTSIGKQAFMGCTKLSEINIPDSVTSIGDNAFSGCALLTDVNLSDSLTSVGVSVFFGCSSLKGIVIPGGVTSIGNAAFSACAALKSIVIPGSVTSIGAAVFSSGPILTIYCFENSVAHNYAKSKSIKYKLINIIADAAGPGCAIDYQNMIIKDLPAGITTLDGYLDLAPGCTLSYTPNANGFGTGSIVNIIKDSITVEGFKIVIPGDICGNGKITALDALMALQASSGKITLTAIQQLAADADKNDTVSPVDALKILQLSTGKITEF